MYMETRQRSRFMVLCWNHSLRLTHVSLRTNCSLQLNFLTFPYHESESESTSCSVVSDSFQLHGLDSPWNPPGQNPGVGSLSLLQGIFPTQGSNPGLPHCRRILYHMSHQETPWILEWVAYPFSRGSSWPRNQTRVSCIAGGFFTNWGIRKAPWIAMDVYI